LSPRILIAVILSSLLVSGCLYKRYHTNSARSATEQLLITESVERAVAELEIPPVSGRRVAFDVVGLGPGLEWYADLDYVAAAFAHRLMSAEALLANPEEAELLMTLRVAAIGTISRDFTLGIPQINVGLYQSARHHGYTKLQLVTRDGTGALVAESKPVIESTRHDYVEMMQIIWRRQDIYPDDGAIGID